MKLVPIAKTDFKISQFPKNTEFVYGRDTFKIEFTDPHEIQMGYYIRSVKVFKNERLYKSVDCSDPSYFSICTDDRKYLALPTKNGIELTNLATGDSAEIEVFFLIGIEFDASSKFCIINGQNESKLVDLDQLKVIFKYKDQENHISQCRFGFDNRLWSIEAWGQRFRIEMLDCRTLSSSYFIMDAPFEIYNIPTEKYSSLIKSGSHCIWMIPNGGMRWSGFLNKWEYVPSKSRIIYKTLIPRSGIRFSKNYNVDSCEADFGYIEIKTDSPPAGMFSGLKKMFE